MVPLVNVLVMENVLMESAFVIQDLLVTTAQQQSHVPAIVTAMVCVCLALVLVCLAIRGWHAKIPSPQPQHQLRLQASLALVQMLALVMVIVWVMVHVAVMLGLLVLIVPPFLLLCHLSLRFKVQPTHEIILGTENMLVIMY